MKYEAGDLPSSKNAGSVFYPMLYWTVLYYINVHPVVANYLAEVKPVNFLWYKKWICTTE